MPNYQKLYPDFWSDYITRYILGILNINLVKCFCQTQKNNKKFIIYSDVFKFIIYSNLILSD